MYNIEYKMQNLEYRMCNLVVPVRVERLRLAGSLTDERFIPNYSAERVTKPKPNRRLNTRQETDVKQDIEDCINVNQHEPNRYLKARKGHKNDLKKKEYKKVIRFRNNLIINFNCEKIHRTDEDLTCLL